ncbi:hypothetical protein BDV96DRAFT_596522 [Lophiotrema nucula]|uniref:SWIM-type domain-containing protein n=1 Tax=Lophiotrema nucula TaxID=690887 RepID=A0A6A5ZIJ2_9PLEO|nr:hypothetical protein BDV96DRAFT_596522 [Lophiotrema nucula]
MSLESSRTFVTHLIASIDDPSANATPAASASYALTSASEEAKKQLLTLHVLFPNEFLPALDLLDRRLVTRFRIRRLPKEAAPQEDNDAMTSSHILRGAREPREVVQIMNTATGEISAPNSAIGQTHPSDVEMADSGVPGAEERTHIPRAAGQDADAAQQDVRMEEQGAGDGSEGLDTVYYVRSAQQKSSRFSTSYESTTSYEVRLIAWNCSCPAFAFSAFPSMHFDLPPNFEAQLPEVNNGQAGSDRMECGHSDWTFGGVSLGEAMPPVCKHLLACVLVEECSMFKGYAEEKEVDKEEAAGWAAGWGD